MQQKLYKKSTLLLGVITLLDIIGIILLIIYRNKWADNKLMTIIAFATFVFIVSFAYAYYDLNADRNYIRKCVRNGDVAIANIKDGSFVRFARDARLKNHCYWKLNADLYDDDMKKIAVEIIEKFSTHQTKIPNGFVYVTYDKKRPEDILIIPNVIISSIPEYSHLTEEYEKNIKPTYLNSYYRDGLILQTYKDSIKQQQEYYKDYLEKVNQQINENKKG